MTDGPMLELIAIETEEERAAFIRLDQFMQPMMERAISTTAESSSWLLASLLAVNGGALIAFLSSEKLAASALRIAGPAWLLGIILALLVGVVNVVVGTAAIGVIGKQIADIQAALISGTYVIPIGRVRWQSYNHGANGRGLSDQPQASVSSSAVSPPAWFC